jgi:hypothetical protein
MRTDMLFGIRFTESGGLNLIAAHYYSWRMDVMEQQLKSIGPMSLLFEILGVSKEEQMKRAEKVFLDNPTGIPEFRDIVKICDAPNAKQFYITDKVVKMCEEIKISSDFDLTWLSPLKDGLRQLNWGGNLIKYNKQGKDIIAVAVSAYKDLENKDDYKYTFFKMDLETKSITNPLTNGNPIGQGGQLFSSIDYHARCIDLLNRFLIFMELSEITEQVVEPGKKHGTKKSYDNLMNTSKTPVTVVGSNWNKRIIRVGDIEVSSHLRRQRWGPGFSQVRPIIIEEFTKKGYNLKPAKEQKTNKGRKHP